MAYLPPNTEAASVSGTPLTVQSPDSGSESASLPDEDDNDLTHNSVPQPQTNVVQQQAVATPVTQQVIATQPQLVNVQKIKYRRPTVRIPFISF